MDGTDWAILDQLQSDSRLSMAELARRIHMSGPAAAERVRRLETAGIITGYGAKVALPAVGRPLTAYLRISASADIKAQVCAVVGETPEVLECHRGTGQDCFVIRVAVADVPHLERIIDLFTRFGQLTTSIVLSSPLADRPVQRLGADAIT